jgi:ferric-dicitrate binding protein FerR (iron transport regulator)
VIVQASRGGDEVDREFEGMTILDAEPLTTDGTRIWRVRLDGLQLLLSPNSAVEVRRATSGFSATLKGGTITVAASEGQKFRVVADGLTIQPQGEALATARVTLLNATEVDVATEKGSLEISMGEERKTLEPGHLYRLEVVPDSSSETLAHHAYCPRYQGRTIFVRP